MRIFVCGCKEFYIDVGPCTGLLSSMRPTDTGLYAAPAKVDIRMSREPGLTCTPGIDSQPLRIWVDGVHQIGTASFL